MKYFKSTDLIKIYKISEKTVRNWVEAASQGKLELRLYEENGRRYIANTSKNTTLMESLAQKGKKYKNQKSRKLITPTKHLYEVYDNKQLLDIITSLTVHRETPLQYTYVDGGAADWDQYAERLYSESSPNILNQTLDMLQATSGTLDRLLENCEKVNVVDLGPGNGLPIRPTVERFLKDGRLDRYIPIDISKDMLDIVQKNMTLWFGDSVKVEPHLVDINYERFNDFIGTDFADGKTANLIFLLGGTLANFRSPAQVLQVINNSLGQNDILIYSGYLDTPTTRRYFDYYNSATRKVPIQDGIILDFLNIDQSLYEVEQKFDEEKRARTISIRPNVDLSIKFDLENGSRYVELSKDEPILIWRHRHKSILETVAMFDDSSFDVMQATKSANQEYLLLTAKIKIGVELLR